MGYGWAGRKGRRTVRPRRWKLNGATISSPTFVAGHWSSPTSPQRTYGVLSTSRRNRALQALADVIGEGELGLFPGVADPSCARWAACASPAARRSPAREGVRRGSRALRKGLPGVGPVAVRGVSALGGQVGPPVGLAVPGQRSHAYRSPDAMGPAKVKPPVVPGTSADSVVSRVGKATPPVRGTSRRRDPSGGSRGRPRRLPSARRG